MSPLVTLSSTENGKLCRCITSTFTSPRSDLSSSPIAGLSHARIDRNGSDHEVRPKATPILVLKPHPSTRPQRCLKTLSRYLSPPARSLAAAAERLRNRSLAPCSVGRFVRLPSARWYRCLSHLLRTHSHRPLYRPAPVSKLRVWRQQSCQQHLRTLQQTNAQDTTLAIARQGLRPPPQWQERIGFPHVLSHERRF